MSGFKAFLLKTNALALAVGVIIGVAMGNVVITFVLVALLVYVATSVLLRAVPTAPEPPTKTCQFCKETVPADATRCRACTSVI